MFKKLVLIINVFLITSHPLFSHQVANNSGLSFTVKSSVKQYDTIKCQLLILKTNDLLSKLSKVIKYDLEFTDQLELDLKATQQKLDDKNLKNLFEQQTSLCLYLSQTNEPKIKVVLKDTSSNATLFKKEFDYKNKIIYLGHKISNALIPVLTGEKGICLSSIAYCKQQKPRHKIICVADYACKQKQNIVNAKTLNVAPCWHTKAPMLFYSQFTKINNRLMSVNLKTKKHKIVCSYDGTNMQPSFSQDGSKAVLCLSGGKNSELYLYNQSLCKKFKKRIFVKLTSNGGNNSSPCLLPNNNIVFCSDFQTGLPQLYHLNTKTKKTDRITNGFGYCASPAYCSKTNSIVYTRAMQGNFQIFTLNLNDFENIEEHQLTFNNKDKHEPSYSECGKYIAFSCDWRDKKGHFIPQIAALNCDSGKIRILTTGKEPKSFPRWINTTLYV